ncbi:MULTISPECIES: PD-(D/E)XK nuclease family protein [unclassified Leptolyngbya]|uniref:PD-(D/E)XK nuclease family protein n=1 Tax=unclassified Leptolyngbya TaxID=2650499 RepID=UPI001683B2E0|nr:MULTISPECIES: PD-(D/E)XK nuclease family protein [unclassified Leptolyngbya]MBD1912901.1 PD-(D/E)XK nuclease family protein [Leptolyngbya sp. FACHB-8]MBD2154770.1 PD-(D/E)XK nuclease family protein [Leptolyngbya sp. FACHB-16]
MMQISQGHLNTLDYCPRLFQHIYLDQLSIPLTFEQQEAMARGSRFHTLMQQHELGLSTQVLGEDAALSELMERFLATAPDVMRRDHALFRQSEHRRQIVFQDFLMTVVYDLLILEPEQADILDWKTGLGLPSAQKLERNWQFKLYPFVLAKTSSYLPEQITMTYWFVQPGGPDEASNPQMMRFPYAAEKHHAIAEELSILLARLEQYLEDYRAGQFLPQVDDGNGHCEACPFAIRCDRSSIHRTSEATLPALNDIHEVII